MVYLYTSVVSTSYLGDRGVSKDSRSRTIGQLYGLSRAVERTQRTKGANPCHVLRLLHQSQRNARGLSAVEIKAK